ncbi:hypothetical protein GCM10011607_11470 [Shewanella inventionis]|uniref:Sel1 repeat family protein n=1 Tax=Shewanella inventionis TaxID=1738770 RepID=A0ABQ1IWD6_9GAMM|nr:sel1 repeat family protein [Shewanella inventionis]GGB52670.1 hypothetical protein GCM10011607_11470 [Shewanella inventionis]
MNKIILLALLSLTWPKSIHADPIDFVEFVDASSEPSQEYQAQILCGDVSSRVAFVNSLKNCPEHISRLEDVVTDYTSLAINDDDFILTCILGRYNLGHFTKKTNYNEALRLFNINTRHGNLNAFYYLGEIYEQGLGLNPNEEVAFGYYSISLLRGRPFSEDVRLRLRMLQKIINLNAEDDIKRFITEQYELAMMSDSLKARPTFMLGVYGNYHDNYCN